MAADASDVAFDVLACAACVLFPRFANRNLWFEDPNVPILDRLVFFAVANHVIILYVVSQLCTLLLTISRWYHKFQVYPSDDRTVCDLHGHRHDLLLWTSLYPVDSRYALLFNPLGSS